MDAPDGLNPYLAVVVVAFDEEPEPAACSLPQVILPTMPSTLRLFFFWNWRTAASVWLPKSPSTLTL